MLESVKAMFGQRKAEAATTYRGLVESAAAGAAPPEGAETLIFSANKTLSDFEADVNALAGRIEAKATLARADESAAERDRLQATATDLYRELEALQLKHREAENRLRQKYDSADAVARAAAARESNLRRRAMSALGDAVDVDGDSAAGEI
ncbi:MAG: hypothetical protein SFV23_17575 [Planctomycetaceae bacterium]|nr:hypothetical protein [Planctomycetaceae bacterium]